MKKKHYGLKAICLILSLLMMLALAACSVPEDNGGSTSYVPSETKTDPTEVTTTGASVNTTIGNSDEKYPISYSDIPEYSGSPYTVVNDNIPFFTPEEITTTAYEYYSELDSLGRCGEVHACLGKELFPTKSRGDISSVKPTGWHSVSYSIVEGGSLYNRSHLIAHKFTGQDANRQNLITGTRYMNATGMDKFECEVYDYIKASGNHVMYRVTPIFEGEELVARGVLMEGYSVEDEGKGIKYNAFCYNVQPGIEIDYATGDNRLAGGADATTTGMPECTYVLNTSSKKIHLPTCSSVNQISEKNKQYTTATREELIAQGYSPCGSCKP